MGKICIQVLKLMLHFKMPLLTSLFPALGAPKRITNWEKNIASSYPKTGLKNDWSFLICS